MLILAVLWFRRVILRRKYAKVEPLDDEPPKLEPLDDEPPKLEALESECSEEQHPKPTSDEVFENLVGFVGVPPEDRFTREIQERSRPKPRYMVIPRSSTSFPDFRRAPEERSIDLLL